MDSAQQAVYDLLPATGELSYADWRQQAILAGYGNQLMALRTLKTGGHVLHRIQRESDGSRTLFVRRAAAQPSPQPPFTGAGG